MSIKLWNEYYSGSLSIESIQNQFIPANEYRISKYIYGPMTKFPGAMRSGLVFIIRGCCSYEFDEVLSLSEGEFTKLSGGDYKFSVIGESEVELVLVWKIR